MKKFLRRSLGALALLGTTFGAKASAASEQQENMSQIVNSDSAMEQNTENDLSEQNKENGYHGLLFSLPTQKKIIENRRIASLFKNVVNEATIAATKTAKPVQFANFDAGIELFLPSEKKTYKYDLSGLPKDYKQRKLKVYEKLVNYILKARIENLTKLNNNEKISEKEKRKNEAKLFCYKKIDQEYIRDHLMNELKDKKEIKWLKKKIQGGFSGKALLREMALPFKGSSWKSTRNFN